ncbi:hypothetical protein C8R42DRAFT_721524 [Lentinula raphanica]|nr:hypothetical protein C8R42DRAFT_721524 [Lentinula raphanica]
MTARTSSDSPARISPSLSAFVLESLAEVPSGTEQPTELPTGPPPYPSHRTHYRAKGTRRRVSENAQNRTFFQRRYLCEEEEVPTSRPTLSEHFSIQGLSQSSMNSLAQTVWVFFSECDFDKEDSRFENGHTSHRGQPSFDGKVEVDNAAHAGRSHTTTTSPLTHQRAAHCPHSAINFPFALQAAWVYLFMFTMTGMMLLLLQPLEDILCFFNLLGACAFSHAELFLHTKFYCPLHCPLAVLYAAAASSSSFFFCVIVVNSFNSIFCQPSHCRLPDFHAYPASECFRVPIG